MKLDEIINEYRKTGMGGYGIVMMQDLNKDFKEGDTTFYVTSGTPIIPLKNINTKVWG